MKILISKARIVDPASAYNGQVKDVFIDNGLITDIADDIKRDADHVVRFENMHLSPGWVDIFADFADPGFEYRETIESGTHAALAGGFTDVMLIPNTAPAVHNKSGVEYLVQKSRYLPVHIHPIGSVSKNNKGEELAEMYDMKASGAVAFSDGINCIQSSGLLLKALQYIKTFDGVVIQLPDDKSINPQGLMNEGVVSTQLGLPGKPAMAEEIMVDRDIKLAAYTESNIHFTGITTSRSVAFIKEAKSKNLKVTCSVTPDHLFFDDEELAGYDTNLKLNPPLRTKKDKLALRQAIRDGIIDCIATHHLPYDTDNKQVEFENAKNGSIGLQTAFAAINTSMPGESMEAWIQLLSINPRNIFNLQPVSVAVNQQACLTAFDPAMKWTVTKAALKSRSKNSPYLDKELTGKVLATINKDQLFLNT